MSQFLRDNLPAGPKFVLALTCALSGVSLETAHAGKVRGEIDPPVVSIKERSLGYTRTRIGAPNKTFVARRAPVALFLKANKSHSIPAPKEHQKIRARGYTLVPDVAACAVDGKVTFINEEKETITVTVDGASFATLKAGESRDYECTVGQDVAEQRKVQIKEWSHTGATVYVGPIGVAGTPDEKGDFEIEAPQGQYELQVVGRDGILFTKEVTLEGKSNANVGKIELGPKTEEPPPPKRAPPRRAPPPKKAPPPPPPPEESESP